MGTKLNPGRFDCYQNALPDEPMFILLGRDPFGPQLVKEWAEHRMRDIQNGIRPKEDLGMVQEAFECASAMEKWRIDNLGTWRKKP